MDSLPTAVAAPPSASGIGAVGTTSAGEGAGRPIGGTGAGEERTFSSAGGEAYGGRPLKGDMGMFEGTTSEIGGLGAPLSRDGAGKDFAMGGTGGAGTHGSAQPPGRPTEPTAGDAAYTV
ncbi:hypothetical protein HYH03_016787 [Edaphochlamys debaryana]|uniref:Uncharacterized protein n=1 Tax=Edaphochlamys debaryana TaxID=47281 RepID=A0A835XLD3_9CHLO|nr:hypothetical protein HYH03_016787 [Edaphochlamys debaryana]|eukprot:KAG2484371.1 hypothetical protein HYH03_016787 [Edaphochlamys debaryana]